MASTLGVHRALVVSTEDPATKGRLRLRIPELFGDTPIDWVSPSIPGGVIPTPGMTVWVMFQGGDTSRPVYISGSPETDLSGIEADITGLDARVDDIEGDIPIINTSISSVDNAAVHKAFTETITGDKNFTGALNKSGNPVATENAVEDSRILTLMGVL